MMQRLLAILIMFSVSTSVLATPVVPHHHHDGRELPCFADDDPCEEHDHAKGDSTECCNLKNYLTSTSPDNGGRRGESHCDCHSLDTSHTALLFAAILPYAIDFNPLLDKEQPVDNLPVPNLYKSPNAQGFKALRAPPVA